MFWRPTIDTLDASKIAGIKRFRKRVTTNVSLTYAGAEEDEFRVQVYIPEDGLVTLTWQVDIEHNGIDAGGEYGFEYPIGLAGNVMYRRAAVQGDLAGAFTNIFETLGANNVLGLSQHYQTIGAPDVDFAVDGEYWYEFSLALSAHTDAGTMSGQNGTARVHNGGGVNFLKGLYWPGAALEA